MKKNLLIAMGLMTALGSYAQTKIKDGSVSSGSFAKEGAILDLESDKRALLLPRVALTSTTTWGLNGTAPAEGGYTVYNTSAGITAGSSAYPIFTAGVGVYYWDGAGWVAVKYTAPITGADMTIDAWVNDPANTMVHLGKKSDGIANRDNYTYFVAKDDGRIGIGTNTPASQLEVKSQSVNATIATIGNVNGSSTQQLLLGVSSPAFNNGVFITTGSGVANSLRLGVNGGESLRIDATTPATLGNVGIGTGNTVINYPLEVHRVGVANNVYTRYSNGQTGNASTDGLLVGVEGTTGRAIINNQESSTMSIYNNGAERITILSNGLVGIGTTTPSKAKLHVESSTAKQAFRLVDGTQGAGKVLVSDADGNAQWGTSGVGATGMDATNDEWINDPANTMVHLGKKSDGTARDSGTEIVAKDNGNLGVGTNDPAAKLHVLKNSAQLTPAIIEGCNEYDDNAAALGAGVPIGGLYRTGDVLKVVH